MFREYFSDEQWIQTAPGVYSCLFQQEASDIPSVLPAHLSPDTAEILYCVRGKVILHRSTGQTDQLGSQCILLLSSCDKLSSVQILEPLEGVCLCIDQKCVAGSFSSLCKAYGDLPVTMDQIGQMLARWDDICLIPPRMWSQAAFQSLQCLLPEDRPRYCMMKSFELLYLLYVGRAETGVRLKVWEPDQWKRTAEAMQLFLTEHISEKWTIDDLSRHFHLSATVCKTCFRTCCGQPIHKWVASKRMERAAELLSCSSMSVIEVAQSVGYNGCSQFNAAFKKKFGKTPRQYRSLVRSR